MQKLVHLPTLVIALGVVLLLGAFAWLQFKDTGDYWSEDDATELAQSGLVYHGRAHQMSHVHSEDQKRELQASYDRAQADHAKQKARFAEAERRYRRPYQVLWWSGMTCLVVGLCGYFVVRARFGR